MTNGSREGEAKSSDEDAFFSLRFHSINLCRSRVGICRDNHRTVNKEEKDETDVTDTDRAKVDEADGVYASDISGADEKKVERANIPNTSRADIKEADKADKNRADAEEIEDLGIGRANTEKV